jgi:hypothetical protein
LVECLWRAVWGGVARVASLRGRWLGVGVVQGGIQSGFNALYERVVPEGLA